MTAPRLVEHFFRHEYGNLVAVLTSRVGVQYLEAVEDAVQSALMKALDTWTVAGPPENPAGWLFQVARNNLIDELRQRSGRQRILEQLATEVEALSTPAAQPDCLLPGEIQDGLLRMLFICCDRAIPEESQLTFALRTLCGFSVHEIALRLFTSEQNVYQRLHRARFGLRGARVDVGELTDEDCTSRLAAVHKIIYLLFTEGYLSNHAEKAIRRELCQEAIRLAEILSNHPVGQVPATFALLALMYLHLSRLTSREDASGGLLMLEEQDRRSWDREGIERGLELLARSADGNELTRYHAEAGIAAEHCLAPSFEDIRWDNVVEYYELLERVAPSAIYRLNRAVATAEWLGPEEGLSVLAGYEPPGSIGRSYMWAAVHADLCQRCGRTQEAKNYGDRAVELAPSPAVKALLKRRLGLANDN